MKNVAEEGKRIKLAAYVTLGKQCFPVANRCKTYSHGNKEC